MKTLYPFFCDSAWTKNDLINPLYRYIMNEPSTVTVCLQCFWGLGKLLLIGQRFAIIAQMFIVFSSS